jgi:hypothetical protein
LHAGFQTLKDDPEKWGETAADKIVRSKKKKKELYISMLLDADRQIDEEERDAIAADKSKVPWKHPPLTKPALVRDLNIVIPTLRNKKVQWDHGETPAGKRSDINFFNWLEEYARLEHKKKRDLDMGAFAPL